MISIDSSIRALRPSTIYSSAQSSKSSSLKRKGRTVLGLEDTPSLISRHGDHDCSVVDMEKTAVKVTLRFFFSAFRFGLAYSWQCKTWREQTLENGDQCDCGPNCQAAHSALSPNLHDDRLEIVLKSLQDDPIDQIKSGHRNYFESRFSLTCEDRLDLNSSDFKTRNERIQAVVQRLLPTERTATFMNTPISKIRNSTYANPTGSNQTDSALEKNLRRIEDDLAERCRKNEIHPKEALLELQKQYQIRLKEMRSKIGPILENLGSLLKSYQELRQSELDLFEELEACQLELLPTRPTRKNFSKNEEKNELLQDIEFKTSIEELDQNQKESLIEKFLIWQDRANGYCTNFKKFSSDSEIKTSSSDKKSKSSTAKKIEQLFSKNHHPLILEKVFNPSLAIEDRLNSYLLNRNRFKTDADLTEQIQKTQTQLKCRFDEIEAQTPIVFSDFDPINELVKLELYRQGDRSDELPSTPNQEDMEKKFLSFIKKLTPTRSDLANPPKRSRGSHKSKGLEEMTDLLSSLRRKDSGISEEPPPLLATKKESLFSKENKPNLEAESSSEKAEEISKEMPPKSLLFTSHDDLSLEDTEIKLHY